LREQAFAEVTYAQLGCRRSVGGLIKLVASFDLGFLGGGQLARMSIQAAQRMGIRCISLDPGTDTPASQIAPAIVGRLDDSTKIAEIFGQCHRVTLENEFIPADAIREALRKSGRQDEALMPGVDTLATIQDKLRQREALDFAGVPSPRALAIDPESPHASEEIGFPQVLKARFGGYDGKGTRYARTRAEFESHRILWGNGGWMVEEFVPFRREIAAMVTDDGKGNLVLPAMETIQANHVCDVTFPASLSRYGPPALESIPEAAVRAVGGWGLFGVELFECEDGRVLVNEIAPRPHNTGHYTLDWGALSQFDCHVRLALGLSLEVNFRGVDVGMANLFGQPGAGNYLLGLQALLGRHPEARFHWYGKSESRPGRKMGHINVIVPPGRCAEDFLVSLRAARQTFCDAWIADLG
jgi:5-(carboxyamino)imidazole ribonucleotide synthase